MVITTGNHPAALWPGISVWHGTKYAEFPKEYEDLVDIETDDKAYVMLAEDTNFQPAQIKPQGQNISYVVDQQGFMTKITHVTYAQGYIVTMEELDDNQYEAVSKRRAYKNAFAMRQAKENVVASYYNNGFNVAALAGADGVAFFSTAHPSSAGGPTGANTPSTAADLSETSLEDATIDIAGLQDSVGNTINVSVRKLIVGRANMYNAARILKSTQQNDTANNAINALKAMNAIPEGYVVNHYLTVTTNWFLRTNIGKELGGITLFQRKALQFDRDNDFGTKNALAASVERYSVGYGDWRTAYGVNA